MVLAGCSDRSASGGNGASDGGLGDVGSALEPPEPPHFTPCPTGWREVPLEGDEQVTVCDPWPESGHQDCTAPDEAHFPGEAGCRRVGTACPDGADWASDLPTEGTILYVEAGAASGGTGSREAPFDTLSEALAAASPGSVVALSAGTFDEAVELPQGVTLWGACVAQTVLSGPALDGPPGNPFDGFNASTVAVTGVDTGLRNLTVTGQRPGILVESGAATTLTDVVVRDASYLALGADGGQVSGHGVVLEGTRAGDAGPGGVGLLIRPGSQVDLDQAAIQGNLWISVIVFGQGSTVTLEDAVIRDTVLTEPSGDGNGSAIWSDFTSSLVLQRSVIEDNPGTAISAAALDESGPGDPFDRRADQSLLVEDTLIRGPADVISPDASGGIVSIGARIQLERARVEGASAVALLAYTLAEATLTDVVVARSRGELDEPPGFGLALYDRASASLTRVLLLENSGLGIAVIGGAQLDGSDVTIERTTEVECAFLNCAQPRGGRETAGSSLGMGMSVDFGAAHATLTRFLIDADALAGIQLSETGEVDLSHGTIADHPVGINLQTEPFDVGRLNDGVVYANNGTNLDSEFLPIPNPQPPSP